MEGRQTDCFWVASRHIDSIGAENIAEERERERGREREKERERDTHTEIERREREGLRKFFHSLSP